MIQKNAAYQANCVKKWKKVLLAENAPQIKDEHTFRTTAVLLENQSRVLKENTSSVWGAGAPFAGGGSIGNADSYAPGDNRMPKVILPMVRRTFPELISNEVVGVQPMSTPVSIAFAMRFRYAEGPLHEASRAGQITAGQATGLHYGVGTTRTAGQAPAVDAVTGATYGATDMTQLNTTKTAEMGFNYLDSSFTGRRDTSFNFVVDTTTGMPYTEESALAKVKATDGATAAANFTSWDEVVASTDPGVQAAAAQVTVGGGKWQFTEQDLGVAALTGDYEATGRIPKAKFSFDKKAVEAGTRRIGTSWTLELEQDIRNMNGIDIETEVTGMMSYELQAEIDREMIVRMLSSALRYNEYSFWDGSKADARWMGERDRAFYQYILQQSNRMAIRNRRGAANFIIATPDVCTLLEALPHYGLMEVNGTVNTATSGIAKIGTVGNGRFSVFRDTRTPAQNNAWMNNGWDNQGQYTGGQSNPDFCLLGYKGPEYWDAGIIFCPYIPIMLQRVVDPVSFEPNVGLMTRYGVVDNLFGSHLYYHVILVDTLGQTLPTGGAAPANRFPTGGSKTSGITA